MTPFALSGILILITGVSMGTIVLIKTPHIFTNRLWAYFNVAMAIWGFGAYKFSTTLDPQSALFWMRVAHIGVITIPVFFLHFCSCFFEKRNRIAIISTYCIAGFFLANLWTKYFMHHMEFIFNSFYYHTHPTVFYIVFFYLWLLSVIYSYYLAYTNIKYVSETKRNQIKYFFLITALGYTGGIGNFLPVFGIMIYPYGNFLVSLFIILTTYVILKYNLLDIEIVIRRSLIYSLLVSSISILFLISVLISERYFHHVIHYQNITTSLIMVSVIALIFTPLKNKIQTLVDLAFFKATPMEMSQQNEKLKAIATLASGLAHEIKNPLTTLKTFSEYVPQKKDDAEFMKQFQRIIPQEIDRIDNLIHELLLFAKPSPPQIQTINPNDIINNIILMLKQKYESFNIQIALQLKANTSVQADPNQIKQALLNLILNAIDAMPNGGTLTIETSLHGTAIASTAPTVIASAAKQSQYIITISDTGCGINPKDLPHIFEPFFSKKEKGTGLGLAITQGIIDKHAGKLSVESQLNQGTTFKIILPNDHAF